MLPVSFKKAPQFGTKDSGVQFVKAKTHDKKWQTLGFDEFTAMKVLQFFNDQFRCVIELKIGDKKCRLVTHDEEFKAAKENFPTDLVVHVKQILNLFRDAKDYKNDILKILIPVGILDAEVL